MLVKEEQVLNEHQAALNRSGRALLIMDMKGIHRLSNGRKETV